MKGESWYVCHEAPSAILPQALIMWTPPPVILQNRTQEVCAPIISSVFSLMLTAIMEDLIFCRYKLELVGHGRKLTWEAKPRSIHEGIASVISSNDCLIFETAMAQHFGENGNLAINVTIYKAYY